MSVVRGCATAEDKKDNVQEKRRTDVSKKLQNTDEDKPQKKDATLSDLIMQAGLKISVKQFWLYSVVSCVLFTLLAKIMGLSTFMTAMACITGLLGFPRFVLKFKAKRRHKC